MQLTERLSLWIRLIKRDHIWTFYLPNFTLHNLRIAFTSLWFQTMPTALLDGHYLKKMLLYFCICRTPVPEYLPHFILSCPLYTGPRTKFPTAPLKALNSFLEIEKLIFFLRYWLARFIQRVAVCLGSQENTGKKCFWKVIFLNMINTFRFAFFHLVIYHLCFTFFVIDCNGLWLYTVNAVIHSLPDSQLMPM